MKHDRIDDSEEDGTRHFMVNVIEPQFNLHSEEANVSFGTSALDFKIFLKVFNVDKCAIKATCNVLSLFFKLNTVTHFL